jgi:5'-nucleotidase
MRFLLTNDDGIYARGLAALYQELSRDAECLVVAPEVEQSAVGHSITIFRPLMSARPARTAPSRHAVAGPRRTASRSG